MSYDVSQRGWSDGGGHGGVTGRQLQEEKGAKNNDETLDAEMEITKYFWNTASHNFGIHNTAFAPTALQLVYFLNVGSHLDPNILVLNPAYLVLELLQAVCYDSSEVLSSTEAMTDKQGLGEVGQVRLHYVNGPET